MRITLISIALFLTAIFAAYSQDIPGSITCNISNINRISVDEYNIELEIKSDNVTEFELTIMDEAADSTMQFTVTNLHDNTAVFTTFNFIYDSSIYIYITAKNANGERKENYVIPPVLYDNKIPYITNVAPATPAYEILERGTLTDNVDSFIRFKITSSGAVTIALAITTVDLTGYEGPTITSIKTPLEAEDCLLITGIPFSDKISDALVTFKASNVFGVTVGETISMKTILTTNAVDNIKEKTIGIYPNPVKDILNIQGNGHSIQSVFISDLTGKTVKQITTLDSQGIDLSDLRSGIYFARILYDNNIKSIYKIVKK